MSEPAAVVEKAHCQFVKTDGSQCRTVFGLSPEGFCFPHDPVRATEWVAMQKNRSDLSAKRRREMRESLPPGLPRAPKTLDDAVQWSSWATHAVAAGVIDARIAHEVSVSIREFRMSLEKRDLALEVERLKKQLTELKERK
jgi:hypothetical protein